MSCHVVSPHQLALTTLCLLPLDLHERLTLRRPYAVALLSQYVLPFVKSCTTPRAFLPSEVFYVQRNAKPDISYTLKTDP